MKTQRKPAPAPAPAPLTLEAAVAQTVQAWQPVLRQYKATVKTVARDHGVEMRIATLAIREYWQRRGYDCPDALVDVILREKPCIISAEEAAKEIARYKEMLSASLAAEFKLSQQVEFAARYGYMDALGCDFDTAMNPRGGRSALMTREAGTLIEKLLAAGCAVPAIPRPEELAYEYGTGKRMGSSYTSPDEYLVVAPSMEEYLYVRAYIPARPAERAIYHWKADSELHVRAYRNFIMQQLQAAARGL